MQVSLWFYQMNDSPSIANGPIPYSHPVELRVPAKLSDRFECISIFSREDFSWHMAPVLSNSSDFASISYPTFDCQFTNTQASGPTHHLFCSCITRNRLSIQWPSA